MNTPPYRGCENWLRLDADPRIWLRKDGGEALGPVEDDPWSLEHWRAA